MSENDPDRLTPETTAAALAALGPRVLFDLLAPDGATIKLELRRLDDDGTIAFGLGDSVALLTPGIAWDLRGALNMLLSADVPGDAGEG